VVWYAKYILFIARLDFPMKKYMYVLEIFVKIILQ